MSPTRRLDDHAYKRTRPTPRSDPAALRRPTPCRDLSRPLPLSLLVRQMVGRISTQSSIRFCRPLASAAQLATPIPACNWSNSRLTSSAARTGGYAPDPLRLDWRPRYLDASQALAALAT